MLKNGDFKNAVYYILKSNSNYSKEQFFKDANELFEEKPKPGVSPVRKMINGKNDDLFQREYIRNFGKKPEKNQSPKEKIKQKKNDQQNKVVEKLRAITKNADFDLKT